jgi:hypothetical protein
MHVLDYGTRISFLVNILQLSRQTPWLYGLSGLCLLIQHHSVLQTKKAQYVNSVNDSREYIQLSSSLLLTMRRVWLDLSLTVLPSRVAAFMGHGSQAL